MTKMDVLEIFKKRCRHPFRARASHVINRLFSDFVPFESPSGSVISGRCRFREKTLYVIGQQKPTPEDLKSSEDLKRLNYGMLTADDHSHILSVLKKARDSDPKETMVFTIVDTYGADISMYSAQRFQAFFIGHLIMEFLTIPLKTISLILGEGGSGGAVAIQYTDIRGMMDDSLYATAPP
jgi:acetyl-CoA carboxylase alpha subunit